MGVWDFIQDQVLGMKWLNELLGIGLGCKWAHWRQRPVFYLRCLENHGAALCIDFCNLLYSKLFSTRAKYAHFRSFSWDLGEHHLRSAGNSDPLLLLFIYPAVHRFYQCGTSLGCDVLLFDFITDGRFRKSCLVNEHFRCKSGDRLCDPWACYRSCRRHHD